MEHSEEPSLPLERLRNSVRQKRYSWAAPIGLIDGERLLDLMFQHDVGVKKRKAILHEVDEAYFTDNFM